MNRWHVYEFIKRHAIETAKFPSAWEIVEQFPDIPFGEIREGIEEAAIQFNREWRRNLPAKVLRRRRKAE